MGRRNEPVSHVLQDGHGIRLTHRDIVKGLLNLLEEQIIGYFARQKSEYFLIVRGPHRGRISFCFVVPTILLWYGELSGRHIGGAVPSRKDQGRAVHRDLPRAGRVGGANDDLGGLKGLCGSETISSDGYHGGAA